MLWVCTCSLCKDQCLKVMQLPCYVMITCKLWLVVLTDTLKRGGKLCWRRRGEPRECPVCRRLLQTRWRYSLLSSAQSAVTELCHDCGVSSLRASGSRRLVRWGQQQRSGSLSLTVTWHKPLWTERAAPSSRYVHEKYTQDGRLWHERKTQLLYSVYFSV